MRPPDQRELIPADHVVHFILEAVEESPPRMLLVLLIYFYAAGRIGDSRADPQTAKQQLRCEAEPSGSRAAIRRSLPQ